jgi:hypothetical protein
MAPDPAPMGAGGDDPAGVEADGVILDAIGEIPRARPVVVASSDRRVRDEARARRHLVRSSQLLSLLRLG